MSNAIDRYKQRHKGIRKKKPLIWPWVVGGLFLIGLIGLAVDPPRQQQQDQKLNKFDDPNSSWNRAWDSLPKKENGLVDFRAIDEIDMQTARDIDAEAANEIAKLRLQFATDSAGQFKGDFGYNRSKR